MKDTLSFSLDYDISGHLEKKGFYPANTSNHHKYRGPILYHFPMFLRRKMQEVYRIETIAPEFALVQGGILDMVHELIFPERVGDMRYSLYIPTFDSRGKMHFGKIFSSKISHAVIGILSQQDRFAVKTEFEFRDRIEHGEIYVYQKNKKEE